MKSKNRQDLVRLRSDRKIYRISEILAGMTPPLDYDFAMLFFAGLAAVGSTNTLTNALKSVRMTKEVRAYVERGLFWLDYFYHAEHFLRDTLKLDTEVDNEQKSDDERKVGAYPYIPFPRDQFCFALNSVIGKRDEMGVRPPKKFIDVGCGIADKLILAEMLGLDAYGIEYNDMTCTIGRDNLTKFFMSLPEYSHWVKNQEDGSVTVEKNHFSKSKVDDVVITDRIIHGNALEFDFSPFDVIYMYRPMADNENMTKLWKQVFKTMHTGAVAYDVTDSVAPARKAMEQLAKQDANKYTFPSDDIGSSYPPAYLLTNLAEHPFRAFPVKDKP